jgi:bifunctional non-homologous end joining protein LigD
MAPDLTERDREKFGELRAALEGVSRAERVQRRLDGSPGPLDPMLATTFQGALSDVAEPDWIAEQKYDGTRLLLEKFSGEVSIYTRRHIERSETVAELADEARSALPDGIILDGEYTFFTPDGVSAFVPIHTSGKKVDEQNLSARFMAFDLLAQDGEWCTREPLLERKARLAETVSEQDILRVVTYETADFQAFYDRLVDQGEEGIMIKRRASGYHLGTRSDHWRKVKSFTEADVVAVGYTPGKGRRADTFGALVMTDGERYVGRVGSGFTEATLEALMDEMVAVDQRPVSLEQVGMPYTPVEPFVIQVKYQEVTDSGDLRAPVYLRRRPEKPLEDVTSLESDG